MDRAPLGKSSVQFMGKLKTKTCRISISILFITCLLFSVFSAAPLRANADELEKRTYVTLDAGLIKTHDSKIDYKISDSYWGVCYGDVSGFQNQKTMAECLEDSNLELWINNSLGPCNTDVSIPCIEEVFARNPNTEWLRGNFSRYLDNSHGQIHPFGEMPQYQTGEQHDRNLYAFPGLTNDPDQLFAIQPLLKTKVVRQVLYGAESLNVSLHAVKKISDWTPARARSTNPLNYSSSEEYEKDLLTCTFMNDFKSGCWDYVGNPLSNQFKLVLRLPSVPEGWLTGRLFSPDIKFELVLDAAQPYRVTLIGSPIPTPAITKVYFSDDLEDRSACNIILTEQKAPWNCDRNFLTSIFYHQITLYQNLKNIIPELDIATKIIDDWQISINFSDKKNPKSNVFCKSDQFNGFVSSNALTYDQHPKFDVALKSLDYMVGGPHFMPDKSVFSGLYSMILTREYAKCIWGLSSPVFNASVQVVDQDGVVSTAVTTIGVDDQFIRFSATGFTFSTKIMKVKFLETKKELDQSKKKIITCVKNKKVVRFVGVASCPKGFKIKK